MPETAARCQAKDCSTNCLTPGRRLGHGWAPSHVEGQDRWPTISVKALKSGQGERDPRFRWREQGVPRLQHPHRPRFRKCINPKCGGDRFRYETDRESNARLQRHDAEQRAQDALLTELTGGAV